MRHLLVLCSSRLEAGSWKGVIITGIFQTLNTMLSEGMRISSGSWDLCQKQLSAAEAGSFRCSECSAGSCAGLVKCGKIASDKKRKNISIFCRTMNVTLHFYIVFYNNTFLSKYFSVFNCKIKNFRIEQKEEIWYKPLF